MLFDNKIFLQKELCCGSARGKAEQDSDRGWDTFQLLIVKCSNNLYSEFDQGFFQMDLALGLQSLTTSTASIPNMGLMVRRGASELGGECCISLLFIFSRYFSQPILGEEGPSQLGGGGKAVE